MQLSMLCTGNITIARQVKYLGAGEGLMSNAWAQLVQVVHCRHHILQDADHHLQVQVQGQVVHYIPHSATQKVLRNLHVRLGFGWFWMACNPKQDQLWLFLRSSYLTHA